VDLQTRGGDFYTATTGDLNLATSGDFYMATDTVGHRFGANRVLVGWLPCRCSYPALGHRTWLCRYVVDHRECGLIVWRPPHDPNRLT
jgi:hypothetical protein